MPLRYAKPGEDGTQSKRLASYYALQSGTAAIPYQDSEVVYQKLRYFANGRNIYDRSTVKICTHHAAPTAMSQTIDYSK